MIDANQLASLWEQHADRLLLVARAWGEYSEDAVQEAFIALALQHSLPQDPLAWLVRTMRNQFLQWHRAGQRRTKRERQTALNRDWFYSADESKTQVDANEVTQCLQELTREDREVIVMHLWANMTFRQIADVTDESPSTSHRRYLRSLAQLKNKVDPISHPVQKGMSL